MPRGAWAGGWWRLAISAATKIRDLQAGLSPVEASWSAGNASKEPKSQSRTLFRALDPINRTSNSSSSIASTSIVAGRLSGGLSAANQGG
jgi:hypothetical protein